MLRKPLLTLLFALLLAGGFIWGLARIFVLRYEVGDIYPEYSSLRADPLGTKGLAETLGDLPGIEMRRNFKPLPKLRAEHQVTFVYTGVPHTASWTEEELRIFDAMVVNGSRGVFTFYPIENKETPAEKKRAEEEERRKKKNRIEREKPSDKKKSQDEKKKEDATKADGKKATDSKEKDKGKDDGKDKEEGKIKELQEREFVSFDVVAKRWGFAFDYLPQEKKAYDRHAALVEPGGHLETDISWHSALCFRDLKPDWKMLYMCGTMPVVIERKFGAGSIVLVADSYLVSNQALSQERHPKLLARIFSGPSPVIFDEESRDLREEPGVASLARKYHLHGVVLGLILLALLFVWKNAVRFIPAHQPQFAENDIVAGKESREGFVNLLRRSINPTAIFEICVAEWRKAFSLKPREVATVTEIWAQEQARPARERDPVGTYRAISRALTRKR